MAHHNSVDHSGVSRWMSYWKDVPMIEAERFLEEKQQRAVNPPPATDCAGSETTSEEGSNRLAPPPIPTTANQAQSTKWLAFVNYILVPINFVGAVISLLIVGNCSGNTSPIVVTLIVDIALCVTLFIGLRQRTSWGWWLIMVELLLKAPLAAWTKYLVACLKADVVNEIRDKLSTSSSRMYVDSDIFIWMAAGGFLLICLPQMVYFYRRRRLFGVQFEGDRK
jgi:hypothetical protein